MRPFLLVLSPVLSASLLAQTQPPAPPPGDQQRPTFRTEANFVRVDVYPTKGGSPVRDLAANDFEILEDGVPQRIETFEYVHVRGGIPQDLRAEPNTVQQSRDALRDPRARVFVLFLDVPHVTVDGTWHVREPLVRLIDRTLGADDLVGVMTPMMRASDIVFARKTEVVASGLRDKWPWGERHTLAEDDREKAYFHCYPWAQLADVVREMKARRRERNTLEAMSELVGWLRYQREERKAVLVISEGWVLYRENADLTRPRVIDPNTGKTEPIPGPAPVGVGTDGRLRLHPDDNTDTTKLQCDADRLTLSRLDNDRRFRQLMEDANRSNASFYTVDPRGLAVFDTPIGPERPLPPSLDLASLRTRLDTLKVLAANTDGLSVMNSNDLDKGFRRIFDDLTSYYLLGYYTTNGKLDGRFRQIKVNVRRPGIDVRARRGYRAATEEEVKAATPAVPVVVPESVRAARDALDSLGRIRTAAPLRTRVSVLSSPEATVWVTGELRDPAATPLNADITVMNGTATRNATAAIAAGQRAFLVAVPLGQAVAGEIDVRVRVSGGSQTPQNDGVRVTAAAGLPDPVMFRRGPSTGNRLEPVADPVFTRTDRLRLEFAAVADTAVSDARVLDRNGGVTSLPVVRSERSDPQGQRWITADVTLAALAAGDYLVELSGQVDGVGQKVLTAFRIIR